MQTISTGHHWRYYVDQVAKGRENYYTKAVDAGEPPGVWQGKGAEALGLTGTVDAQDMEAVYGHFVDPRDPRFKDREAWDKAAKLGRKPMQFKTPEELYEAKLAKEPDASPERREQLRAQSAKEAKNAVGLIDITYSPPKSVTVLHTAYRAQEQAALKAGDVDAAKLWGNRAELVEQAVWAGHNAGMDYLNRHAGYARVGYHGTVREQDADGNEVKYTVGRWTKAEGWVTAAFFQHTSRANDPQLHIHGVTLNRAECEDGKWRTLDSRGITKARPGSSAIADLVAFRRLERTLGTEARMRPDGVTRELVGVSREACELWSSRSTAVTKRLAVLVGEWRDRYGREPNALQLSRLSKEATLQTRPGKSATFETPAQRVERLERELRTHVDQSLAESAHEATGRIADPDAVRQVFDPQQVLDAALTELSSQRATWNEHDLVGKICDKLPDLLGDLDDSTVVALVEDLAQSALNPDPDRVGTPLEVLKLERPELVRVPDEMLVDGRSPYAAPNGATYTTRGLQVMESALEEAAATVDERLAADPQRVAQALEGRDLGSDQRAAVEGILTSGRQLETLIGPAGAGKTYTVGHLSEVWQAPEVWAPAPAPRVFGLATGQQAANVMAEEGVGVSINVSKWLRAQERIGAGRPQPEDEQFRLRQGDLVVVDEAATTPTPKLEEIQRIVAAAGAKTLYAGDPEQTVAVGAGGAMRMVARTGVSYELDEVRRFAEEWERAASLRLRDGEIEAVAEYERHGRIVDGGTLEEAETQAVTGWLADTLQGHKSLLIVDTNEQAARLSAVARAQLEDLGRVQPAAEGITLADGSPVGVGDTVQARKLDWSYRREQGHPVVTRDMYTVLGVTDDGGLHVQKIQEEGKPDVQLTLKPNYVAEHLTLGYAVTVHAAQGATVDTDHEVITPSTPKTSLYPGLTRGRLRNTGYVQTVKVDDGAAVKPQHVDARQPGETRQTPLQVLGGIIGRHEPELTSLERERQLVAEAGSLRTLGAYYNDMAETANAIRYQQICDDLVADGTLKTHERATLDDNEGSAGQLWRLMRAAELAGHDPREVLTTAVRVMPLDTLASIPSGLHARISHQLAGQLTPVGDTYIDRTPDVVSDRERYLVETAELMDARRHELGSSVAEQQPEWALRRLGPVPDDVLARGDWEQRAGTIAAYREQFGITSAVDAIGPCPKIGQPEARAAWHAAWRAYGAPTETRDTAELTVTELHERVEAYEREKTWAPDWVGEQLQATADAARRYRQEAVLRDAQAKLPDTADREQVAADAKAYADLADELDTQMQRLERINYARGLWYAETVEARALAEQARKELELRDALEPKTAEVRDHTAENDRVAERNTDEHSAVAEATVERVDDAQRDREDVAERHSVESREHTAAAAATAEVAVDHQAQAEQELAQDQEQTLQTDVVDVADTSLTQAATRVAYPENVPTRTQTEVALERAEQAIARIEHQREAERIAEAERVEVEQREMERAIEQQLTAERDSPSLEL